MEDFKIKNGVLVKYHGNGGDVVIPDGATSIGNEAFAGCSSLTSITIPEGVTSIDSWAFNGCENLKSITLPDSLAEIGLYVFQGCSSLESITIPEKVKCLEYAAFCDCENLTDVTLPQNLRAIYFQVFMNCTSLKSITIPEHVRTIKWQAFAGCSSLKTITVPNAVRKIESEVFSGCRSLTNIEIPNGVTDIGEKAFSGCSKLKNITMPEGVLSIGEAAFKDCKNLVSITIPASVKEIGKEAFAGCAALSEIHTPIKLTAAIMGKCSGKVSIQTDDIGYLPLGYRPYAAVGFAQKPDDLKSARGKSHLKYIKSNAESLTELALKYSELLQLMCEQKCLTPEVADAYLAAAQNAQNLDATAILLNYIGTKLTAREKEKAVKREDAVTEFVFSADTSALQGKTLVVTGKLLTFASRDELKACLAACGITLTETLNAETDYLLTNTPDSGSAKNKKAEQLGIKKITETEFNAMIGRHAE